MKARTIVLRLGSASLALGVAALGVVAPAVAYEVPVSPATSGGGIAAMAMPGSALTTTYATTGLTTVAGATQLGNRGYVPGDYTPGLPATAEATAFRTDAHNNCPDVGPCEGLGTITVQFSQPVRNPILTVAGLGASVGRNTGTTITAQTQLHAVLTLASPGVGISKLSGGNLAVLGAKTITAVNHSTGYRCDTNQQDGPPLAYPAAATSACGSVQLNGVTSSLTFNVGAMRTQATPAVPAAPIDPVLDRGKNIDGFTLLATAPEDFGDAPASYDGGNAARAVLSDVTLGSAVSEDNASVANGAVSPSSGPTASGDDGVTLPPLTTSNSGYSTTVALAGASKAGTVCGWVDADINGTFDLAERTCAPFAGGATGASLTWSGLAPIAGATFARFRVGYNASQVESPTGPADSGEVEDYRLVITTAPAAPPAPTGPGGPGSGPGGPGSAPGTGPAPAAPGIPQPGPLDVTPPAGPDSPNAGDPVPGPAIKAVTPGDDAVIPAALASTGASLAFLPAALILALAGATAVGMTRWRRSRRPANPPVL